MKKSPFLSCFFPAFNEEGNIANLLEEVLSTIPRFADRWEAVVVDDGSTDRTAEIVRRFAAEHPQIRLAQHERNLGYGHALRTGLKECAGAAVFFTDADQQFHLEEIEALLAAFGDADVVIGYRIKRRDPWHRLVVARIYKLALRGLFNFRVRDIDCAFKLFSRKALTAMVDDLRSRSAFISPELVIRSKLAGFRVAEVGVHHYLRTAGKPKGATLKVTARTIGEIIRLRSSL